MNQTTEVQVNGKVLVTLNEKFEPHALWVQVTQRGRDSYEVRVEFREHDRPDLPGNALFSSYWFLNEEQADALVYHLGTALDYEVDEPETVNLWALSVTSGGPFGRMKIWFFDSGDCLSVTHRGGDLLFQALAKALGWEIEWPDPDGDGDDNGAALPLAA